MKPIAIIESPYAAKNADGSWDVIGVEINVEYARACLRDSLLRGEAPFASHLLYTQQNVLRDQVADERELGIMSGFEFKRVADVIAVYTDLGISPGMQRSINIEEAANRDTLDRVGYVRSRLVTRSLPEWTGEFVARRIGEKAQEFGGKYIAASIGHIDGVNNPGLARRMTKAAWLRDVYDFRDDFFARVELVPYP